MNLDTQRSIKVGAFLIVLGLVWWLRLWFLIWPGALVVAGILAYTQRRSLGRTVEAVQAGFWCIGLALLFLTGFLFPGILFLVGGSILMRGHEFQVDAYVQNLFTRSRALQRSNVHTIPSQQVPISSQQVTIYPNNTQNPPSDEATTGQTMRLP